MSWGGGTHPLALSLPQKNAGKRGKDRPETVREKRNTQNESGGDTGADIQSFLVLRYRSGRVYL